MKAITYSLAGMRDLKRSELPEIRKMISAAPDRTRPVFGFPEPAGSAMKIIAEVKKSSPSRGGISGVKPEEQAALYAEGGAAAISAAPLTACAVLAASCITRPSSGPVTG